MADTEGPAAGEVAEEEAVNEKEKCKILELQGWHRAKEAASRHNRNLLQYAAAIAVVLGIEGSSGGIFAVAIALLMAGETTVAIGALLPRWAMWVLGGVGIAGVVVVALLASLLIWAFLCRQKAERQADCHRNNIIRLDPGYFPSESG